MKMSRILAQEVYWRLVYYFPIDCAYPNDLFMDVKNEKMDSKRQWQISVDLIYRLLSAGLIRFGHLPLEEAPDNQHSEEKLIFCQGLAQVDPRTEEINAIHPVFGLPWFGVDLCITKKTRTLLEKHGLVRDGLIAGKDWEPPFNESLIEEIEDLFLHHGVAWSDEPLIPIRG